MVCLAIFVGRKYYWYPITNKDAGADVIVAFGDSLTYGTGAGRGQDWPSLVSEKCNCRIVNKGVPGDTSSDALARLDRDVLALDPQIVIIGLGGNDILQRTTPETMFGNLRTIIDRVQDSGAMVVLLGLNGFPLASSLGGEYKALARETGSVYVPNILGGILTSAKLRADQVHPNAEGYKIIADRVYDKLEPHL